MIEDLLPIIKLTHDYNAVVRDPLSYDLSRHENDSEHSFQLAMVVWYLADKAPLQLNHEKLLKYALVHDLVEVYAGDTAPFTADEKKNKSMSASKDGREAAALDRLKKEFPDFNDLTNVIEEYEKKRDPESRFVYIWDKIIADLNCFLSGEKYYVQRKFSYTQWTEWFAYKSKKLDPPSPFEKELLEEYFSFMTKYKERFFPR